MKLSVVIVNYNVRHFLWQCLDAVKRASAGLDVDVFVVDNASTDGSIEYVSAAFPNVHYISNTENVGFARANNQAIRQATGDLLLLLNPDTIVAEETLAECICFMENHPRAGALGIHMINRDGSYARESRRGLPTPATAFYKVIGLCSLFPTHPRYGRYYMGHLSKEESGQIEIISGAFMMLRQQALDEVGLLDEGYFMYGEDIDLSYRISSHGWECWYTPSLMLHYKGESSKSTSLRYIHSFYNAMLIFFRKHFARRYWFSWIVVELAVVVMGVMAFVRNHLRSLMSRLRHRFFPQTSDSELLCFMGSDEGWTALQPLLQKGNLNAQRISSPEEADPAAQYLAFEVTADGQPYHDMLVQLSEAHAKGCKAHIGTFNLRSQTLILPNDIIC